MNENEEKTNEEEEEMNENEEETNELEEEENEEEEEEFVPPARIVALEYTGGGIGGSLQDPRVPARDLSPEEVKKYGRELLLKSGLYKEKPGGGKS